MVLISHHNINNGGSAPSPVPQRRSALSSCRKFIIQGLFLLLIAVLALELYIGRNMFHQAITVKQAASIDELKQVIRRTVFSYFAADAKAPNLLTNTLFNGAEKRDIIQKLPETQRKRIIVTGGAGFIGSHLVDKLMDIGHAVTVLDNFYTGNRKNLEQWVGHPNFNVITHDIVEPIMLEVDEIYHLACPSSPEQYQTNPIKTLKTNTRGTMNILGLAKRTSAKILIASTGDIYGHSEVHPQPETYWGRVNPIGTRACYEEGKRVAETMTYAFQQQSNLEVRVARIFNTFGRRMHPNDGRVLSTFITKAIQGKDLDIYGTGSNKRSFQYVEDLVDGLIRLMDSNCSQPVNIGNPESFTIENYAKLIIELANSKSTIRHISNGTDIPNLPSAADRTPDITLARRELNWAPQTSVRDGLQKTIAYFRELIEEDPSVLNEN